MSTWLVWLQAQLTNNQLLIAGIGTVVSGTILYFFRSIPSSIYHYFKRLSTIELGLNSRQNDYAKILRVLSDYRSSFFSRTWTVGWSDKNLHPGYGFSFGFYHKVPFFLIRTLLTDKINFEETANVTFLTRKVSVLKDLMDEASKLRPKDVIEIDLYKDYWMTVSSRKKRYLTTVFTNNNVGEKILNNIKEFLAKEDWYIERGIPYKHCVLLHGQPGTGKTSLVFSIASELKRDIGYLNGMDIYNLTQKEVKNKVLVLEDVDCLDFEKRDENENETKPKTSVPAPTGVIRHPKPQSQNLAELFMGGQGLHRLLNTLDGLKTPHGLIIFMTTNHIEKLDHALVRNGRMDQIEEIESLEFDTAIRMIEHFYGEKLNPEFRLKFKSTYSPMPGSTLQTQLMTAKTMDSFMRQV